MLTKSLCFANEESSEGKFMYYVLVYIIILEVGYKRLDEREIFMESGKETAMCN